MAIVYAEQDITQSQHVVVHTDTAEEWLDAVEYMRSLGYQPKSVNPRGEPDSKRKETRFSRWHVVASTKRGDKIQVSGEYELAEGT